MTTRWRFLISLQFAFEFLNRQLNGVSYHYLVRLLLVVYNIVRTPVIQFFKMG